MPQLALPLCHDSLGYSASARVQLRLATPEPTTATRILLGRMLRKHVLTQSDCTIRMRPSSQFLVLWAHTCAQKVPSPSPLREILSHSTVVRGFADAVWQALVTTATRVGSLFPKASKEYM